MRDHLLFYVNGQEHRVSGDVFLPLSTYLRGNDLTGTKVVCAEGDCGACTILSGRLADGRLVYKPINSCIQYLYQLDCSHVVTVEGLGQDGALNPVQEAMVNCHGAQCGYCTPGIIVAMCALFNDKESVRKETVETRDIQDALTGNLCRCTGYEPIIKAGLSVDAGKMPGIRQLYPDDQMIDSFRKQGQEAVLIEHGGKKCFIPDNIKAAVDFKEKHPNCVLVSGGTDVCVNMNKRGLDPDVLLSLSNIPEMAGISLSDGHLDVGGRAKLAELEEWAREEMPELHRIIWLFGSPQIRHAGTLAGNIANGSPIADTIPWLMVMEAVIEMTGGKGKRLVNINSLYKGYKKLDMRPDEIITRILIPLPEPDETIRLYKVSRRQNLDISAFTAAIRLIVRQGRVESARIAYGGVGPVVLRLPKVEAFLSGKEASLDTFAQAGKLASQEITPISDVRGSRDFRLQLSENIMLKFYREAVGGREHACQP